MPALAWPNNAGPEANVASGPVLVELSAGWVPLPGTEGIMALHLEYHGHFALIGGGGTTAIWDLRGPTVIYRQHSGLWFWPEELPLPVVEAVPI